MVHKIVELKWPAVSYTQNIIILSNGSGNEI